MSRRVAAAHIPRRAHGLRPVASLQSRHSAGGVSGCIVTTGDGLAQSQATKAGRYEAARSVFIRLVIRPQAKRARAGCRKAESRGKARLPVLRMSCAVTYVDQKMMCKYSTFR